MPLRMWTDPVQAQAGVADARSTWDRIRQNAAAATPGQAQALSNMQANYPFMRPGVAVPLAQSGLAPDSPQVQAVATQEAKRNKKNRGVFGWLGDHVPPNKWIGNVADLAEFGVRDVLEPLADFDLRLLKGGTRTATAAMSFSQEFGTGLWRNVAQTGPIGAGITGGAATGASVGLAGGPLSEITVPVGAAGGAVIGGIAGALSQARGTKIESEGFENPFAQTTLGQQFAGRDVGSGYFAAGTAHTAALESQRRAASINGHALTPGRLLATSVTEPGTKPYNLLSGLVDTANAWELDPTQHVLKGVGRWRKSFYKIEPSLDVAKREAGLVEGARNTVLTEAADQWMQGQQGARAVEWLADQTDFETIRRQLGGNKVDISTVMDLTNARTADDVTAVLRTKLGTDPGLVEGPKVGTMGMDVKRTLKRLPGAKQISGSRLLEDLPSGELLWDDPTEAVHQFNLLQRDANIPLEVAGKNNRRMAEALLKNTPEGKLEARSLVLNEFLGSIGKRNGIADDVVRKLTRQITEDEQRIYGSLVNADGTRTAVKAVSWGGKSVGLAPSGRLADLIDRGVQIDRGALRDIRASTSRFAKLVANPAFQTSTSGMDWVMSEAWKPAALLRGAWTVRVIGEEQIRMAAAGKLSIFNHPLAYMSWMLDEDTGRIGDILRKIPGVTPGTGATGFTEEAFAQAGTRGLRSADVEAELWGRSDDYTAGLSIKQQGEGWHDGNLVRAKHQVVHQKGEEGYYRAWAEKIEQAHTDPLMRELACTGDIERTRLAFTTEGEELNSLRLAMVEKHGAPLTRSVDVDTHLANAHANVVEAAGGAHAPTQATLSPDLLAGGAQASNPAILTAIERGELAGTPLYDLQGRINGDFVKMLKRFDEGGPAQILGAAWEVPKSKAGALKDRAVQSMFTEFMSRPSAKLSRSPHFRQAYWDEADNLIYQLDVPDQELLLDAARKAKLPEARIKQLQKRAKLGAAEIGEGMTLEEADLLAKGRALDQTRDLLYDAAQRGQLSDVLRIVFPFAEAQKEVMKVWAKIGVENPNVARRAQQVIQGARGAGVFYTDPQTGEEMFTFPGSEILTEHTVGLKIPLVGRVQGLNMFGSGVMPGVGPAVQIPVRWMLPDKPKYDDLRDFLDPFGASAGERQGIVEQNLPSWFTKVQTALSAPDSDRVFANTVKDVWSSGISAGIYSSRTPDDIKQGLEDAKHKARILYLIRGIASVAGAPTAPSPQMMARDKDGKWIVADKLAQDYKAMTENPEIGWQGATQAFVEKYGMNAAAFLQAKTFGTTAATATTTEASQWLRENADVAEKYGSVAGLFAPQGEEFDYTAYLRNIRSGVSVTLTPEQYVRAANDRIGKMIFYAQKDRLGPDPSQEQRQWLSRLRDAVRQAYPGFDEALPGKPDQETVKKKFIPEIERAVNDPALADNRVAQAAKVYLQARAQAQAAAEAAGYQGFQQPKDMEATRDWLRRIADALSRAVPDFAPMWDRAFEREMAQDRPEEVVTVG